MTTPSAAPDGASEVRWAPRVPQQQIRRLYEADALGLVDAALVDEVGYGLEARCRSILVVAAAQQGRVQCPRCARAGRAAELARPSDQDRPFRCAACGWQTTWRAYRRTYQDKQLNAGGATAAFAGFVEAFARAHSPQEKLLAADRVIHAFHRHVLRGRPEEPTRAAGVNLIGGTLREVLIFLDGLTYGQGSTPGTRETLEAWRADEARRRAVWER